LQGEIMRFDHCQPGSKIADLAKQALASQPGRGGLEASAEMNLALAEDLWKQEQKLCGPAPNGNDPIDRVLARMSRQ
jgi:hypothetical protein